MDMAILWGIFRQIREEVQAKAWVLITALGLDTVVLSALLLAQRHKKPVGPRHRQRVSGSVFAREWLFLKRSKKPVRG
jgi:hypothetical protein